MKATKEPTKTAIRVKRHRYRAKMAEGKATEKEISWLKQHDPKFQAPGHVRSAIVADPPGGSSAPYPAPDVSAAVPSATPPPLDVPPLPAGGAVPDPAAPPPPTPAQTAAADAKQAQVGAIVGMAASAWKKWMKRLAERAGESDPLFPDEFVDDVWAPAVTRLAVKHLPDGMSGDLVDAATAVVPVGVTFMAAKELAKNPPKPDNAPQGAMGSAQRSAPPPARGDVPPAADSPKEFRRVLREQRAVEMPKNAVF